MQKSKWLSEEALQTAEKREVKGKGEKIYPFECRVPKNSKEREAFFSHQCKEIEEKNRMGKTRDLFKKIGEYKGTFHAKMDTIKDRTGKDLNRSRGD